VVVEGDCLGGTDADEDVAAPHIWSVRGHGGFEHGVGC
jgi:hypothetical protein